MSYVYEVHELGTAPDKYIQNSMRFATRDEAEAYGFVFSMGAFFFDGGRVVESDKPVTAKWDSDSNSAIAVEV